MAGPFFWVGGSGNWSDATNHWATASGGAPNAANVPSSASNVIFDSASNATAYTVTVDATANCLDMTWALPGTSGVPTLSLANPINIFGSLTLITGQVLSNTSAVNFTATATGKTITNAGVQFPGNLNFTGVGGGWTMLDGSSVAAGKTVTVSSGTLVTGAFTHSWGNFVSTSGTRTLTLTNSTINVTGTSGTPWNVTNAGTLTITLTGSTLNFNGNAAAGVTRKYIMAVGAFATVAVSGSGVPDILNSPTVTNFSYTSTSAKTDQLLLGGSLTIGAGGSLTIAGNSVVNRAFIASESIGVTRTVTVPNTATVTLTNVDFQDIASAGTFGTWTGTSLGDALGNSGITFDGSTTQTYTSPGTSQNWSTAANWTSRVPLPQDDVVVGNVAAGTLFADMPRLGRNVTFTGFTRTLGNGASSFQMYGNLAFGSAMTLSANGPLQLAGRGAQTLTCAGNSWASLLQVFAFGGTYTAQDAINPSGLVAIAITWGTLDANGFNVNATSFATSNNGVTAKLGSGIWSISNTSGTPWNIDPTTSLTGSSSTIKLTGAITSATFAGAGKTYGTINWSSTASTGTLIITGANSFAALQSDNTTARTIQFPNGVTQTFAAGGWQVSGKAGAVTSIKSDSAGNQATLSMASGTVNADYLSITASAATGGATWYGGGNSVDVSDNSGWIFASFAPYLTADWDAPPKLPQQSARFADFSFLPPAPPQAIILPPAGGGDRRRLKKSIRPIWDIARQSLADARGITTEPESDADAALDAAETAPTLAIPSIPHQAWDGLERAFIPVSPAPAAVPSHPVRPHTRRHATAFVYESDRAGCGRAIETDTASGSARVTITAKANVADVDVIASAAALLVSASFTLAEDNDRVTSSGRVLDLLSARVYLRDDNDEVFAKGAQDDDDEAIRMIFGDDLGDDRANA